MTNADADAVQLEVDVQRAFQDGGEISAHPAPTDQQLIDWAGCAYNEVRLIADWPKTNELTIRLVASSEVRELNLNFRNKDKTTNVLSFPFETPPGVELNLLGDVVICHEVVVQEALDGGKGVIQHYAHMVTHGLLHLCGYDHQCDKTAEEMEAFEAKILAQSGYPNPYL